MNRFIYLSLVIVAVPLFGQKTTPAPSRPTIPTSPTSSTNPTTNTNTNSNSNTSTTNTIARPIYLSGKVVLQDGTPPPDLVRIERVCSGSPHPQGYTDSKGRFQFQLDSGIGVEAEAGDANSRMPGSMTPRTSTTNPISRVDLNGCDLRAVLPGFVSGSVSLSSHGPFDNSDVGTIVLRRIGNVDGTTVSMSSLNAPKDALKAYDKGREALRKEKPEDAEKNFLKAVDIYPKYAMAWFQLGMLQNPRQALEAENSFQQAIASDPKFISPYLELTLIYERSSRWDKALDVSTRVIKLNSTDFPEAHFYRAVAQFNLHDLDGSHKSALEAVKLDPQHRYPQSEKLLGIILARKRDLPGAAEHLRNYLQYAPKANDAGEVEKQLAQLEKQPVAAK